MAMRKNRSLRDKFPLDAAWRRALLEEGDERKWARANRRRAAG
jgi:hypothetical protein